MPGTVSATASAYWRVLAFWTLGLLLAGCNTETLFQSSFNTNALDAPPAPNQAVGTVSVAGDPGSVVVVATPPNATSDQWVQIGRLQARTSAVASMEGNLSAVRGPGKYSFLAALYIPSGTGFASLDFQAVNVAPEPQSFLHLDFASDYPNPGTNVVRVNDEYNNNFGAFLNDHVFTVAVSFDTTTASPTAHVQLLGTGASGSADIPLIPIGFAQQFGAIQVWMGFPWAGAFDATDILVTHDK